MPSWVGTSAGIAVGTTSATPAWPTGYTPTAGHAAVMVVCSGHPTASTVPNTPSGWVLLETRTGGGGAYGADAGPRRVTIFTRELVGGDTLSAVTQASGTQATISASVTVFSKASGSWQFAATSGEDTTAGTGFSCGGAADPGFAASDAVLLAYAIRSDTPTVSAEAITAAGAVFAASAERLDLGTTQGNDHRHAVATTTVSSGTATAAPTITATLSAAHTGVAAAVRLREVTGANLSRTAADTAAASDSLTRTTVRPRAIADTAATTDISTRLIVVARPVTDSAGVSDSASGNVTRPRTAADAAPATDVATRAAQSFARITADTAGAVDAVARSSTRARNAADTAPATDVVARVTAQPRAVADTAAATDTITRVTTRSRTSADTAPATDTAARATSRTRTVGDIASISDSASGSVTPGGQTRTAADTAPTTDTVTRILLLARAAADTAPTTDTAAGLVAPPVTRGGMRTIARVPAGMARAYRTWQ